MHVGLRALLRTIVVIVVLGPAGEPLLGPESFEFGIVADIGMLFVLAAAWWTHKRIA